MCLSSEKIIIIMIIILIIIIIILIMIIILNGLKLILFCFSKSMMFVCLSRKRVTSRLTLCPPGKFLPLFLHLIFFFQNQLFRRILSGIQAECQTFWVQVRPDIWSGLVWVQTDCKSYQQMTLGDKRVSRCLGHQTV